MATRTYCSFEVEEHGLTLLGSAIFLSTLWVIYMIRFKLKPTYSKELDSMPLYSMVVPPAILAVLIHPHIDHRLLIRIVWSFSLYLAAVSVLPQLRLMQNAKMVEPFTAYYVFALGVARFLNCGSWIIHGAERPPTSYLTPVQPCYVAQAIVSASSATISGGSISCMSSEARHETDYCTALRRTIQDLIDQGLVHLGQPSVTTNPLPAHTSHAVPPSADNIHFMDFTEPVDRIHMLSWEDFEPEPIVVDESYEVDGVILDPQASTPFRLVPNTPLVQLTTVGPLIHQCYSIQYPFILSRDPDEMVTQDV
ncbi:hypothetical protein VitviT2T_007068 [Vitis vinifera]|uniref:ER lumen protein-retaining receptor C28H8.4 n=1 Tax=Vitis vinifera TaxID=29760 RepID=A0ABY9BYL2_VITVI|nr:hypothetical protein VitviT2T_007068 [Vitis vinifera]